uniref:Uncharacterized protein n=1 Tax=viral metagenome TaxID=1070528 RepID=A0A6C0KX60_9ZZZZ|tara:strand:- start:15492 stop:16517 length:1026 start_codon:yes stop_codon:yes gene_type:complete
MELEEQWKNFMSGTNLHESSYNFQSKNGGRKIVTNDPPECTKLKISTKSKIVYLNQRFDLDALFWKVPIVDYDSEKEGVIKKQMKFNFTSHEQVTIFEQKLKNETCVKCKILNQIDNPSGRISFKDVRKIDIGYSKNDLLKPNKQSKSAFYNCFVIIFRKIYKGRFREFHAKLFNSGKIEIPGIQEDEMLELSTEFLVNTIQDYCSAPLVELKAKRELVLVNSNFNCQYYLNRELLLDILKKKYKIKCSMDSCSYPGIQCKYKINDGVKDKEVSFMIFRTGSVLIVGKCEDQQLYTIYHFLVKVFHDEYKNICEEQSELELIEKEKTSFKKRTRKGFSIYI